MSADKFSALRECVPEVPKSDFSPVLTALQGGTNSEKEEAVVRCACMATRGSGTISRASKPLPTLLRSGSETQKLWVKVIKSLAILLQKGNDLQKLWAADALGSLAVDNEAIRSEIGRDAIMEQTTKKRPQHIC
ncbi:hypothetical protein JG687_00003980 [Phytophthora cactorum]|uniref:Armadillo-type fold n=1 Tax=Phytophthora cactorum TaxID=29920 RepID=A0A329T3S8_9STRA|nr:hypothetical protein PC128_g647 [Phytophthora cactorum]KAG6967992.1 hypothetical protein JG687_00003980 [Phytophthora cactorum]RAW42562.1 hypothetical protein PC110_g1288 [Phytophthora cactorum]